MKRKTFLMKAALTLLVALFSLTGARAEELTVYDGTATNTYVPMYVSGLRSNNTSYYVKTQFIIPAADLTAMSGATVTALKFYTSAAFSRATPNVMVFVKEVDYSTFNSNTFAFETTGGTTVYTGTLNTSNSQVAITFSTPFTYNGGNLLISIGNTGTANQNNSGTFLGENNHENAACYARQSRNQGQPTAATARVNFLPKTTFTYTFAAPTSVTATNIKTNSASIGWNGTASSYNLRYASTGSTATIILTAHDVWGDGSGYQMLLDADANAYGTVFTSNGGWTASDYSAFEYTAPVNADCSVDAEHVVVDGSITIQIPAGTYDWCITNPTPGDKIYIASSGGNVGGRQDDYVFEGGKTYEFSISLNQGAQQTNDKVDVTITDNSTIPDDAWTTISNVTSPYSLENLQSSTSYRVEIQAVYSGGVSEWAGTNFTTLAINHVVTDVTVTPQSTIANISWTGESDSYQIKYKKKATTGNTTSFFEDFESGLDAQGWTTVRNGGGTTNTDWHQFDATNFDDESVTNHSGSYVAMSRSYAGSAYNVDNWLITPQVTLDGMLKYWVCDDGGYHEHYDIYISTTGTNIDDFTLFYEPGNASSTWTEVSVDLSSFAGQLGYIALRNTDYDQDFLLIDDFGIYEILSPAGDWMTATTTETLIELTALVPGTEYEFTIIGIKDGVSNSGTPVATFTTLEATTIELANAGDNTDLIEALDGMTFNVQLVGRTLSKNDKWNSLCLPFDLTIASSVLDGATAKEFDNASFDAGTLTLNFKDVTELKAGKPYIIKWADDDNLVSPVFEGVTIKKGLTEVEKIISNEIDENMSIVFKGTYEKLANFTAPRSILYVGSNNNLNYPGANSWIGAQRAYFTLSGLYAGAGGETAANNYIKECLMDFDNNDDPTGIENVNVNLNANESIYNVAGQRMGKMQKGINIVNGKKIIVK